MDSNSRIKGLIRFIFSYIIEKEDNLEGEEREKKRKELEIQLKKEVLEKV